MYNTTGEFFFNAIDCAVGARARCVPCRRCWRCVCACVCGTHGPVYRACVFVRGVQCLALAWHHSWCACAAVPVVGVCQPGNPDWCCAAGEAETYSPNPGARIHCTKDGGATWTRNFWQPAAVRTAPPPSYCVCVFAVRTRLPWPRLLLVLSGYELVLPTTAYGCTSCRGVCCGGAVFVAWPCCVHVPVSCCCCCCCCSPSLFVLSVCGADVQHPGHPVRDADGRVGCWRHPDDQRPHLVVPVLQRRRCDVV